MNLEETANRYADGKAKEALTQAFNQAIAHAYMEGYKAGFKDRDEEISMEFCDRGTEYVDLGLPSGTLWAADYEREDDNVLYLPYPEAKSLRLPTREQWDELFTKCRWFYEYTYGYSFNHAVCVGPNGKKLTFRITGRFTSSRVDLNQAFFWLQTDCEKADKEAVIMYNQSANRQNACVRVTTQFMGYRLPVWTVK